MAILLPAAAEEEKRPMEPVRQGRGIEKPRSDAKGRGGGEGEGEGRETSEVEDALLDGAEKLRAPPYEVGAEPRHGAAAVPGGAVALWRGRAAAVAFPSLPLAACCFLFEMKQRRQRREERGIFFLREPGC